ncbi:hypothetical protein LJB42_002465 [Komagataella kurtzmanii]|nr:hypothetical protein LJB42_002465 [Komagataella kurtzmanii]
MIDEKQLNQPKRSVLRRLHMLFLPLLAISFFLIYLSDITQPLFRARKEDENPLEIYLKALETNEAHKWSKVYTSQPHLAGTNYGLVEFTKSKFEEYGFEASVDDYDVYLSYPIDHSLELYEHSEDKKDKLLYKASLEEDVLSEDPTTSGDDLIPTFLGYGANGNVSAEYIYANYGTKEDFEDLVARGVPIKGKIAVIRYGQIFRGLKVKFAQEYGAIGAVIYSDPGDDYGITPENGYKPYPHGKARNPSSVQRGSAQFLSVYPGDPTTPGVGSKKGVERVDPHATTPSIPVLPLSFKDALPILKKLNKEGLSVPDSWKGGLEGVDYSTGPAKNIHLNLYSEQNFTITPIYNVYGEIKGENADEVIIVGNHRDAWIKGGASDPNSGSAALIELSRGLHALTKTGWKPHRTIVLASWDAEEYGLIGSTEFGEQFEKFLQKKVVAYLNVDVAVAGTHLHLGASPSLFKLLKDNAKEITFKNSTETLYDNYVKDHGNDIISTLGSGSDYTVFLDHLGIPSLDIGFIAGKGDPVYHYHSNYDSYHWISTSGDPGFEYHNVLAKYLGSLVLNLSEREVLYLKLHDYATELLKYLLEAYAQMPEEWDNEVIGFRFSSCHRAKASHHGKDPHHEGRRHHGKGFHSKEGPHHGERHHGKGFHAEGGPHHERGPHHEKGLHVEGEPHHQKGPHFEKGFHHDMEMYHKKLAHHGKEPKTKLKHLKKQVESLIIDFANTTQTYDAYTDFLQKQHEIRDSLSFWEKIKLHFKIKAANFKLKYFERVFLHENGLKNREWFKHIVYAAGRNTGYAGQRLPGLVEAIEDKNLHDAVKWLHILSKKVDSLQKSLE